MSMRLRTTGCALLLTAIAVACSDATAPDRRHPLSGTYDVETTLTTFSFETAAPSPPDCTSFTLYCTHVRPATGVPLSGVLVVGDSTVPIDRLTDFRDVHGTFTGRFCDTIDYQTLTGCAHLGESTTIDYPLGTFVVASTYATDTTLVLTLRTRESLGPNVMLSGMRFRGDSLTGAITWRMTVNRSPPTFYGTFVARRRT
jgi:hypothetical protein